MRAAIRRALPGAEETISYKIPTYKLHGKTVVHFAGWANHVALYPTGSAGVVATFKKELAGYDVSKGTIRFSLEQSLPIKLIERIRAAEGPNVLAADRIRFVEASCVRKGVASSSRNVRRRRWSQRSNFT